MELEILDRYNLLQAFMFLQLIRTSWVLINKHLDLF